MFLLGRAGGVRWLVVFLGNPGPRYAGTRHNAGYLAGDAVEKRCGVKANRLKFRALTARCTLGGESVVLIKPQTYMNLSGEAVKPLAAYYKVPPERILVVSDETALAPGRLRMRRSGSAGGHNGLKSIIAALGTEEFPRLRIGVGAPPREDYDMADWVLSVLRGRDAEAVSEAAERAAEAVECWIRCGPDEAMSRYNS
jgi:PTH1 family peptidyl-tRNA hydrolase